MEVLAPSADAPHAAYAPDDDAGDDRALAPTALPPGVLQPEARALSMSLKELADEMRDNFEVLEGHRRSRGLAASPLPAEPVRGGMLRRLSYWGGRGRASLDELAPHPLGLGPGADAGPSALDSQTTVMMDELVQDLYPNPEKAKAVSYYNPLARGPSGGGLRQRILEPHKFVWVSRALNRPVGVRYLPDATSPMTGTGVYPGELVEVDRVCLTQPHDEPFYHVADPRRQGWVFVYMPVTRQRLLKVAEGTLLSLPPELGRFVYSVNPAAAEAAAGEAAARFSERPPLPSLSMEAEFPSPEAEEAEAEQLLEVLQGALPTVEGRNIDSSIRYAGNDGHHRPIGVRNGPCVGSTGPGIGIFPGQVVEGIQIWIPEPALPVPDPWVEVPAPDGSGDVYYWQTETGLTQWERPLPSFAGDITHRVAATLLGVSPQALTARRAGSDRGVSSQALAMADARDQEAAALEEVGDEDDVDSEGSEEVWRRSVSMRSIRKGLARATGVHGAISGKVRKDRSHSTESGPVDRKSSLSSAGSRFSFRESSLSSRMSLQRSFSFRLSGLKKLESQIGRSCSLDDVLTAATPPLKRLSAAEVRVRSASDHQRHASRRYTMDSSRIGNIIDKGKKIATTIASGGYELPGSSEPGADFGDAIGVPFLRLAGGAGWVLMQHPHSKRHLVCNVPLTIPRTVDLRVRHEEHFPKPLVRSGSPRVVRSGKHVPHTAIERSFVTPTQVRSLAAMGKMDSEVLTSPKAPVPAPANASPPAKPPRRTGTSSGGSSPRGSEPTTGLPDPEAGDRRISCVWRSNDNAGFASDADTESEPDQACTTSPAAAVKALVNDDDDERETASLSEQTTEEAVSVHGGGQRVPRGSLGTEWRAAPAVSHAGHESDEEILTASPIRKGRWL